MSNDLTGLSATELARLIRLRTVSPVEVVEAHLRRIDQINPSLNAIVTLADDAIDRARAAEARLSRGDQVGLLHGLPLTIKDTIDVKGLHTTSGSSLLADNVADRDATAVARLKSAGAIIVGKTNVAEMAAYWFERRRSVGHCCLSFSSGHRKRPGRIDPAAGPFLRDCGIEANQRPGSCRWAYARGRWTVVPRSRYWPAVTDNR